MEQLTDKQKATIIDALNNIELPRFFTYTGKKPSEVIDYLVWHITVKGVRLKPYYPKWKWSKTVGYRNKGEYVIYYNVYRQNDEVALFGLIVHEVCHMCGIGHGSNCMRWYCDGHKKTKSANVHLEKAVKKYLRKNK